MALGRYDLSLLTLPVGWDATALENERLVDGTTYAEVAQMVNTAIASLNAELRGDQTWSLLVSYTDEAAYEYSVGVSNGFEVHTEYGLPDPRRAEMTGHMLPLTPYDRRLGWTWDYLRKARMSQIEAGVSDAVKDARDLFRVRLLTRLLKRGDDSGVGMGLGTSGLSPGFATAAASTGVDFAPPSFGGTSFTTAHEHYVAIAGGAFTLAVFQDARDELEEHGHTPPFTFFASPADETAIKALTGFIPAADPNVRYGALQDVAVRAAYYGTNGVKYIGTLEGFEIYVVRGLPQYYGVGFKSYGPNSQRNPIRVRVPAGQRGPQFIAIPDPNGGNANYPLQNLMLFTEFGIGVGDRTAATLRYVNNANWSDGTPT
jgi:hypothetical protein